MCGLRGLMNDLSFEKEWDVPVGKMALEVYWLGSIGG